MPPQKEVYWCGKTCTVQKQKTKQSANITLHEIRLYIIYFWKIIDIHTYKGTHDRHVCSYEHKRHVRFICVCIHSKVTHYTPVFVCLWKAQVTCMCVCVHGKDTYNVCVHLQACERTIRGTYVFACIWKTHNACIYMFIYKTHIMYVSACTGRHMWRTLWKVWNLPFLPDLS